ncbi:HAMP domain-containing sensor histidine kinase [Actinacidiphila epipremni]|nr:HAMP domain-containing sensor histidine kinase [Actinacidiphila epipremni]
MLAATAVVAAALALTGASLFASLDAGLTRSARELAAKDAGVKATAVRSAATGRSPLCSFGIALARRPVSTFSTFSAAPAASTPPAGPPDAAGRNVLDLERCALPKAFPSLYVVTEQVQTGAGPVTVQGTASLAPVRAARRTLVMVLAPGVPALLALVALLTWFTAGRALRPVSAIRAKVADITARDLHERVPQPAGNDEVAALAKTVNGTLDRLQTAVGAHRQFVADAAHELRSPLAALRTRLELARPAERRLAGEALADVARLQALTADLLLLARLDAREPVRRRETDLAQIVAEEAARPRPRTDVAVAMRLTPDVLVDGSPDHLRRLVANLVDNAVRHAGGTVTVTLTRDEARGLARLDVADDGPGIPAEHRAAVFDRFTRLDHARTRDTGGSGLGLPIARDIAAAHGGSLHVVPDRRPGATLRAVLPLSGGGS